MKLPLVTSILLSSAYASVWPYRGPVAGQSAIFVASAYAFAPVNLMTVGETIAGPKVGPTIIQGASTGPVSIIPGNVAYVPVNVPSKQPQVEDAVLIKGPSAGPVTLIGASDRPRDKSNSVISQMTVVTNGSREVSVNETETRRAGIVSDKLVVGPSTGPIVIAGPTAVPVTVSTTTVPTDSVFSTTVGGTDATPVSVTVTTPVPNSEPVLVTDGTVINGSGSRSKIDGFAATSSTPEIYSTVISGPSGSISTRPVLISRSFQRFPHNW